jgi:GT2 family glycosyltransferase
MDGPRLSVIVPTLNRRQDLLEFTETLVAQTRRPNEFIVVDAGQVPDMEEALLEALDGSGIALVYRRSKAGTSLQRNIAMDLMSGEFIFMFDDDILLETNYIEKTLEVFSTPMNPPIGCVLGTFSSPSRPRGWQQKWFKVFGMTHSIEGEEASLHPGGGVSWLIEPTHDVAVPVASGGRTAYRYQSIENERFDEFLPGYTLAEDVEFSYRIAQAWTIVQSPDCRLFHKRSPSSRVDYGDRVSRLIYSRFYFFKKHLPKDLLHTSAWAWSSLGITALYLGVAAGKSGERVGVIRGIARGYRRCAADLLGREIR